jgi:hypothetical protein
VSATGFGRWSFDDEQDAHRLYYDRSCEGATLSGYAAETRDWWEGGCLKVVVEVGSLERHPQWSKESDDKSLVWHLHQGLGEVCSQWIG